MTHTWRWHCRLQHRFGEPCRILARGKMNSCLVQFADGTKVVTSRYAVRKGFDVEQYIHLQKIKGLGLAIDRIGLGLPP